MQGTTSTREDALGRTASGRRGWVSLLGIVSGLAACSPGAPPGVGVALSTPFANAARLALADALAEGRLSAIDTLMFHEMTNSAQPAIGMAEQFAARGSIVAVVGHSNSAASLAAAPLYNGAGIVQVAPTSTALDYAEAGSFSFRLAPSDDRQADVLTAAIQERYPGGVALGIFYVNDAYGRSLRAAVLERLDTTRNPVVVDWPHNDEDVLRAAPNRERVVSDFARVLSAARPPVLLLLGRLATVEWYLPAIRLALPQAWLLGGDGLGPAYWRGAEVPEWVGVQMADFLDLAGSEAVRDFRRRYEARFGVPARAAEVLSYDAMRLVLAGVADGARSGAALRDWLLSLGSGRPAFEGLSGPITFDARGEVARGFVLVTVPPPP